MEGLQGHFGATFRNMQLKKIKRSDRKGQEVRKTFYSQENISGRALRCLASLKSMVFMNNCGSKNEMSQRSSGELADIVEVLDLHIGEHYYRVYEDMSNCNKNW